MTVVLEPVGGSSAAKSFMYWGERQEWLIALSKHRDSNTIERSNWDVIVEGFNAQFEDTYNESWAIERFSNWAVGWTEHLLVKPGTPEAELGQAWAERLARYPVADDEHHSMLEYDEQWCVRCDRGIRSDHPLMDRNGHRCKFRSEAEADEIAYAWRHRRDFR